MEEHYCPNECADMDYDPIKDIWVCPVCDCVAVIHVAVLSEREEPAAPETGGPGAEK